MLEINVSDNTNNNAMNKTNALQAFNISLSVYGINIVELNAFKFTNAKCAFWDCRTTFNRGKKKEVAHVEDHN